MGKPDTDLQFIFEGLITNINSFRYFHYKICHPPNTKINIGLSLARRILRIFTDTKNQLQKFKDHLIKIKLLQKNNWLFFYKNYFNLGNTKNDKKVITFTKAYNLCHQLLLSRLKIALETLKKDDFKKHLIIAKYSLLHDN